MACDVEGYGYAEFVRLSGDYPAERRTRSRIPINYVYQKLRDFKWALYPDKAKDEVDIAEEVSNLFVSGYTEWRKQGRGLYIWSKVKGCGKTMLACCLANEVIDRFSAVVKYINATEYVKLVASKDHDRAKEFMDCGLLVFDDIGAEDSKKEWIAESIYRLIDHRYTACLPTIFTSNNAFAKSHIDDRIHSRIRGASVEVKLPDVEIRELLAQRTRDAFLNELRQAYG